MKQIKEYFDIKLFVVAIISALIHAFAVMNFTVAAKLYPAGFSGITRLTTDILKDFYGINLSYSLMYLTLNVIATLIVFRKIGKKFAIYSIVQFTFDAIFTSKLTPILILDDRLLMAIFGGIINGVSVGIALAYNFSTGGTDFFSVYFANKLKKDVWNYIFAFNVGILCIAGVVYGWESSLYSIIFQYASTRVIKMLHNRYTHKTVTIITKKPTEVANSILEHVRHGITEIKATGYYSGDDTTMLYTVVNSFQYKEVERSIIMADPNAFINVQNTVEIVGNYYQKPLD